MARKSDLTPEERQRIIKYHKIACEPTGKAPQGFLQTLSREFGVSHACVATIIRDHRKKVKECLQS